MEIEIVKEKETPLVSRKRVTAWINHTGRTPSRVEILDGLSKKLKVKKELISIRHIYTRFGEQRVKLIIHVYNDKESLVKLEGEGLVKKHQGEVKAEEKAKPAEDKKEEAEAPAEAKSEEKTEEKPKEDKKEEAKPEEKTEEEVEEKSDKKSEDKKEEAKPEEKAEEKPKEAEKKEK